MQRKHGNNPNETLFDLEADMEKDFRDGYVCFEVERFGPETQNGTESTALKSVLWHDKMNDGKMPRALGAIQEEKEDQLRIKNEELKR